MAHYHSGKSDPALSNPPGGGIGRKGLAETWFELDLALVDEATAGYLPLVFSADALAERGSTRQILAASSQYAVDLGRCGTKYMSRLSREWPWRWLMLLRGRACSRS